MITGIEWAIVISFVMGATMAVFWDKIKAWASKVWHLIVDVINTAIEVVSNVLVYLVKEAGRFYKQVKVFIMNKSGKVRVEVRRQELSCFEIPNDILQELERKRELLLMKECN